MKWHHGRTSGVFGASGNAAVTAVQGSMAVQVSDGSGWITNSSGDGIVWWNDNEVKNGAKLQLAISAADSTLNRIDRVIVAWKTTNYVDFPEIKILKGTAASVAKAPALTNNSTVRQISLARITINAGTTALTPSMITDERLDPAVCGIVTEQVELDTTTMQDQFQSLLVAMSNELVELKKQVEQAASGSLIDKSVTRAKLANDALYSPILKPTTAAYAITATDFGKTYCDAYSLRNNNITLTMSKAVADAAPVNAEIAFARTYNLKSVKLTITGARIINLDAGQQGGASSSVTFSIPERGGMFALKKVEQDNSAGSFWILTGNAEVVS